MSNQEKVRFLEYQKPALETGDYQVEFAQLVETGKGGDTFHAEHVDFSVQGERFSLDPSEIHVMFPPPGSLGRHSDCFPHISIKRSTFPWERSAYGNEDFEPWLALLLFDEEEIIKEDVKKHIIRVDELQKGSGYFPEIKLENGQENSDKITVIDVKRSLLEKLLPSGDELKLLSHVRQRVNGNNDNPKTELAVIMANRLPKEGSDSVVHLVSLEERYNSNKTFNYGGVKKNQSVRLVSLKSWSFGCLSDQGKNFEELVEDISSGEIRLPKEKNETTAAEPYLSRGYMAIPHDLRQCDKTYSWYHGPLSPISTSSVFVEDEDLPEFSDELVHYHKAIGMFDSSYASAHELGRVLAISDDAFSKALFQWKYQLNEEIAVELQSVESERLIPNKSETNSEEISELETKIKHWFKELSALKQVPFNYLVPDEKVLEPESIRFFKLDNHWIECLLLGAFSIGGTIRKSENHPVVPLFHKLTNGVLHQDISGFLIRSQLVSDYPDLLVDAYSKASNNRQSIARNTAIQNSKLKVVRADRIGPDVLLYLVEGEVSMAELYLNPEGLRFGLDEEDADDGQGMKYDKDIDVKTSNNRYEKSAVPLGQILNDKRVVDVKTLSEKIQSALGKPSINSALFGMHMIEGSNKGRFVKA